MKKTIYSAILILLLSSLTMAENPNLGIGLFGGMDIPVVQDDQDKGTTFGVKGRLKVMPIVTLEPNIYFTQFGDPTFDEFASDLEGSKVTAYGVDATFGAPFASKGLNVYGVVGAGFYNVKRDQTNQDETDFGWSAGLGSYLGFAPNLAFDLRSKLHVIPSEGGGSKKSLSVTGGINLYFGN